MAAACGLGVEGVAGVGGGCVVVVDAGARSVLDLPQTLFEALALLRLAELFLVLLVREQILAFDLGTVFPSEKAKLLGTGSLCCRHTIVGNKIVSCYSRALQRQQ